MGGLALLVPPLPADDSPPRVPSDWPNPAQLGRERPTAAPETKPGSEGPPAPGEGEAGEAAEPKPEGEAKEEEDGPLDPFFDLIDPAKFQRGLDKALAGRFERRRPRPERPEVPEIGEPVFFDLTRPLGAKRYSNEINYLFNSSTATAPTLQVIEYEYTFADWNSVELDLSFYDQILEVLTPFYQRTLGVGCGGRSVHGVQISTDIYRRSGFIGGTAVYNFGWKPSEESRFSLLSFIGANRQLIGGFFNPTSPRAGLGSMATSLATNRTATPDPIFGAWRPTFNIDLFYQLTETLTLGIENDLFFQTGRSSEYLSFPFLTWEAGQHSFFQAGGGYYHFEGRDQYTFLLHLNFVNPAVKASKREAEPGESRDPGAARTDGSEASSPRSGPIKRWIERRRGISSE